MSRASTANVSRLFELTDDEAITLRRIAFSESDIRSLRRGDVDRLLKLRLVAEAKNNLVLTISGKEQFDSLPRSLFAAKLRQRNGW
jgi:YbbR domain-containing protein